MEKALLEIDERLRPRVLHARGTIHGIGEGCEIKHKVVFPIAIAGVCGEIESVEIDDVDVPLLISRSHQAELDLIFNIKQNSVVLEKMEIYIWSL